MTRSMLRLLAAAGAFASAAGAQTDQVSDEPQVIQEPAPTSAECCVVPALLPVEIEIVHTMNSRSNRSGEMFPIRLAEPIIIDGRTVAPAGTTGMGEVVHAAKARAMGKAGELILAARYLELNGQRIPLRSLRYGRSQGKDNSGAIGVGNVVASAVLPAASVVAFLISGGEVNIPASTRANAKVSAETRVTPSN